MPDEPVSASDGWKQIWFAATATTVFVGLVIQPAILFLGVSAGATALDARLPRPPSGRAVPEAELPVG